MKNPFEQPGNFEKQEETNIEYWEQVLNAPTPAYQELFEVEKKYLVDHIEKDSSVLDVGCGEGRNMQSILEVTPNVWGIDNDAKAVEDAKKRFEGAADVQVEEGSADELPFEDETFDTVTLLMILPNLDTAKAAAFQEAARVLKKEGKIIVSTFSETALDERMKVYKMVSALIKEIHGSKVIFDESLGANTSEQFSLEELEDLGREAGLAITDSEKVGDLAYILTYRKV